MHEGYKKYLEALKAKGMTNPMPEKEWEAGVGIVEEEKYTPFLSRKSSSHKHIAPTLQNHIKPSSAPQIKINIVDKPKKTKREPTREKLSPEQKKINSLLNKKRWYRNKIKRECGRDVVDRKYISLDHLTAEEKKERRLEQQRAYKRRKKEKRKNESIGL